MCRNFKPVASTAVRISLTLSGDIDAANTLIEAHTLVNAQVGWRNDDWEAVVECKNCFDEEWFGTNLFNVLYTADPVRWGLRVKRSF